MRNMIYVYISLNKDYFIGKILIDKNNGKESVSFEYSDDFFNSDIKNIDLDPDLFPYKGRQYADPTKPIFGFLSDASPNRWGRILLKRRELQLSEKESRKPTKLTDMDYLLGVYDKSRMGALRFKENPDGPFLSDDEKYSIPPWMFLRELESYAGNFDFDETIDEDWVKKPPCSGIVARRCEAQGECVCA